MQQSQPDVTSIEGIINIINRTLLDLWADVVSHVPHRIGAIVLLLVTALASKIIKRTIHEIMKRSKLRHSLRQVILRLVGIVVWIMGLLVIATLLVPGLTPSKALGGLGIVSIAIGFAFRDIFENFFAGILLLWRFPFEDGDFIECEGIMGEVLNVNVRMTELRTVEGEHLILPNSFLYKNPVHVLTAQAQRRQEVTTGIAYGESVDAAVKVLQDALAQCETIDQGRGFEVLPKGFGSSSIDIDLLWWSGARPLEQLRSRGEVVTAAKRALYAAGIEIPFPYRTLTFKEPLRIHPLEKPGESTEE